MKKKRSQTILASVLTGVLSVFGFNTYTGGSTNTSSTTTTGTITQSLTHSSQEVDVLHNNLVQGKSLSKEQIQLLQQISQEIETYVNHGGELTQKQKDLRYFANTYKTNYAIHNLDEEITQFINNNNGEIKNSFVNNLRNQTNAVSTYNNQLLIDFTKINLSLSQEIMRLSKQYNLSSRLIATICTIENNFGLTRTSESGAQGMCQTKPEIVRTYFTNYDSMNDTEKNFAHFKATFLYLKDLKDKYNLSIGFNDGAFNNKNDFLKAAYFYHSGESEVIANQGKILDNTQAKQYLLKLLDSFNYTHFILQEDQNMS